MTAKIKEDFEESMQESTRASTKQSTIESTIENLKANKEENTKNNTTGSIANIVKEVNISENTEFYFSQNLSVEDTEFDLSQNPSDPSRPDIKKSKFDFGFNTEAKITEIIKDPMYLNLYSSFLPKLKKSFQNPTTEYKTFINTSWNLLNQHVPRQKEEDKSSINPEDFENFYLHTLRKLFEDNIIK